MHPRACSLRTAATITLLAAVALGCGQSPRLPDAGPLADAAPPDAAPLVCFVSAAEGTIGGPCREAAPTNPEPACNPGLRCIREDRSTVGGVDDPIQGLPDGAPDSFIIVDYGGDYCAPIIDTREPCSDDDRAFCADQCGVCADTFSDANACLHACTPNATDNDICRDGYQCDLLREACDPGCRTNFECRVTREDTDGNGMIEDYNPLTGLGDRLVYHPESEATCNLETRRCEHPGLEGAFAGDPCVFDEECEQNGKCFDEINFGYEGGYCTKLRCDLEGLECAGDRSVCMSRGVGFPTCLATCTVGTGVVVGDTNTYLGNTQGCRQDYTCVWDGTPDTPSGGCLPGEFNAIAVPNIGAPCTTDDECYSPLGQGLCLREAYEGGYCTVQDCSRPGIPTDICGADSLCVEIDDDARICMDECTTPDDCRPGYACGDIDGDTSTEGNVCFAECLSAEECRAGETCDEGRCR